MSAQNNINFETVDADTTPQEPQTAKVSSTSVVAAAQHYAKAHGLAVFPCRAGEKTPATTHGCKDATLDPDTIAGFVQEHHNLAIATGIESGIFVLDVDMPGGDESLGVLESENEALPATVTATTTRGGKHYYFRMPDDVVVKNSTSKLGSKLDIRGEGGYVVAPPSSTATGEYKWESGRGPDEVQIADAPVWLVDLLTVGKGASATEIGCHALPASGDDIPQGSRNSTLTSIAGSMRREGFGQSAIAAALAAANSEGCKPPLSAAEVNRIAASVARYAPKTTSLLAEAALPYRPFPVTELPTPLGEFVTLGASAIGCDESYIALPLLSGLASAIGNSYRIELKPGWAEPAILWTAIVGNSGTMKSPGIELALRPVRKRQQEALVAYDFVAADYRLDCQRYERELATWKKSKTAGDPPVAPDEPVAERTWVDDITVEALAIKLLQQPRGLLVARDELAGWLGSFDRYSQSAGGDSARWLEMFGGRQLVVDRKTGEPATICVPRASVSVTGGIQPGVLDRALSTHHRENGLAARLLLAYPPRKPKVWNETEIDPESERTIAKVFGRLYSLGDGLAEHLSEAPNDLTLSAEAKSEWVKFYNDHAKEQAELSGDLAAAYSKLEGYAARIGLVLHLATWAADSLPQPEPVQLDSIQRARRIIEWFKYETRRIYAVLGTDKEARQDLQLIERMHRAGGRITPRELMRSGRDWPTAEVAEEALQRLAHAGIGNWETKPPTERGGRPTRELVLIDKTPPKGG